MGAPVSEKQARRRRGTGSVRQDPATKLWQYRLPTGRRLPGGGYERIETQYSFETDALAIAAMDALREELRHRRDGESLTLTEYFDQQFVPWMKTRVARDDVEQATLDAYVVKFGAVRRATLGGMLLRTIRRLHVVRWAKGLAGRRPDQVLGNLKFVLKQAIDDGYVDDNAAASVQLDVKERDRDDFIPTPEEQLQLLSCHDVEVPDWYAIVFGMGTGLRPGEWRNLELIDVHLDGPVPWVFVQYGKNDRGGTKSGKKRKVPLLDLARRALEAWLPLIPQYHPKNPRGLVFPTERGCIRRAGAPFGIHHQGRERINKLDWYLERAGITRHLTPHCLRHRFATDALTGRLGKTLEAWKVQVMLGHGLLSTTEQYLHQRDDDLLDTLGREQGGDRAPTPALTVPIPRIAVGAEGFDQNLEDRTKKALFVQPAPAEAAKDQSYAVLRPYIPDAALIAGLRDVSLRIAADQAPLRSELAELALRVRAGVLAHLTASHPVLRTVERVLAGGDFQTAAFIELTKLVAPAATEPAAIPAAEKSASPAK